MCELMYTEDSKEVKKCISPWDSYELVAEFPVEKVLEIARKAINDSLDSLPSKKEFVVNGISYTVNMTSLRYQTFLKSISCVKCGLVGSVMRLEFCKGHTPVHSTPHFNLYGVNSKGIYVMLTKDHIMPKAKGGSDKIDNLQTMCATCNFKKSDSVEGQEPDTAEIQARILSSGKSLPVCNSLNTKEIMVIRRTYPDIKVRAIAKEVLRWRNKEKEISKQQAKKAKEEKKEAKHEAVDTGDSA